MQVSALVSLLLYLKAKVTFQVKTEEKCKGCWKETSVWNNCFAMQGEIGQKAPTLAPSCGLVCCGQRMNITNFGYVQDSLKDSNVGGFIDFHFLK